MATVPVITFKHTATEFIVIDSTGNYNVVSNPTGWGSPNTVRTTAVTPTMNAVVVSPSGTSTTVSLLAGNFANDAIRSQNIASSLSLEDGIWTITVNYTGFTVNVYTLRDASIKCALGKLALGDMSCNDYSELKMLYDKMLQAMECGEYLLAEEIYADIQVALNGCPSSIRKSCGC